MIFRDFFQRSFIVLKLLCLALYVYIVYELFIINKEIFLIQFTYEMQPNKTKKNSFLNMFVILIFLEMNKYLTLRRKKRYS